MIRVAVIVLVLAAGATLATYMRYDSLHPCDWLHRDMVLASGHPEVWVQIRIRALFFLEGIDEPDAADCLRGWWDFRVEELEKLEDAEALN